MPRLKKFLKHLFAIFFGIFLALVILEIVLRIWHPFKYTVRGDKIILAANIHVKMKNDWIKKLDDTIYYSRNSLGLRGEELPMHPEKFTTIITVGGSTTECKFLSDSKTWPELLKNKLKKYKDSIWVNNAGLDGHSTFGHVVLMKDYIIKLHPKYVLFLTGTNDVELDRTGALDDQDIRGVHTHSVKYFFKSVLNYSEVGTLMVCLYRNYLAYKKGLVHKELDPAELPVGATSISDRNKELALQKNYLTAYTARLDELKNVCLSNEIKPVFITQPALYGNTVDSTTGIFMGNLKLNDYDCATNVQVLEMYNNEVRKLRLNGVGVIDLAAAMPKNSKYYYDFMHYTNAGAEKVATIISDSLRLILK
ncbi:MAG: GDSL-type esterase/lipase family protein [Ginsengibacter sp.]